MRLPVLLALPLLLSGSAFAAASWSVTLEAPPVAPLGLPFLVRACVAGDAGGEAQVLVRGAARAWQEGAPVRADRYGPPFRLDAEGRACRDVTLRADEGTLLSLEARARPGPGEAAKGRASAVVPVARAEAATVAAENGALVLVARDGSVLLRVPAQGGWAHVPLVPNATAYGGESSATRDPLPAPDRVRIAEVRKESLVLANEGTAPAWVAGHAVDGVPLPAFSLAPGERILVGPRAAPDLARHVDAPLRVGPGPISLHVAGLEVDRIEAPKLRAHERADRDGVVSRLGHTRVAPEPMEVEGALLAYATPHAGAAPVLDVLDSARREILLEGYTLTSPDVGAALLAAHERGVSVRVLLEAAPVGGVPPAQKEIVGALAREGVTVLSLGKGAWPARFATVHAKVVVADRETLLVATENFHAASYPAAGGDEGTRGFGLVVRNATLARLFADVLDADAAPWPDVAPVPANDAPAPLPHAGSAAATAGPTLERTGRWRMTPILAPDADVGTLPRRITNATRSVDVAMLLAEPAFDDGPSPFLDALVAAARGGARVRLLLDGRLDPDAARIVVEHLRATAAREGLPLEARLADPRWTLHAKLVLMDGRASYVGSMNWGEASATRNREAGLLVEDEALAAWYGKRFEKEWEWEEPPGNRRVVPFAAPGGLGGMLAVAALLRLGLTRPCRRPRTASPSRGRRGA